MGPRERRRRCRDGGTGFWMDSVASSARCDSKRLETRPLAGDGGGQYERRNHMMYDPPRLSIPPDARLPPEHVDPPRRPARLKTRPRRIRVSKETYQVGRWREAISGESERSDMSYRDLRWCRSDREARNAKTRPLESIEADRALQALRERSVPFSLRKSSLPRRL